MRASKAADLFAAIPRPLSRPSANPYAIAIASAMQTTDHELVDERSRVDAWRLHQFLEVGYTHHRAEQLAGTPHVDVHLACWLLANGCSQKLALKILL